MAFSVADLIAQAFYTSGIVSRQFQTVAGDQEAVGLLKLNQILTDSLIEDDMIPYFNTGYNFNLIAGQEKYFIPNMTKLETFTFFIDSVRYSAFKKTTDRYFGSARANNILSLPFSWNAERTTGGMNLFLYFFPQTNYPAQLTGWFTLQPVALNQDLLSPLTTVDLGFVTTYPAGVPPFVLSAGQLVVNGVDLAGSYANANALMLRINTGIIPLVSASLPGNNLVLTNLFGNNITVSTLGTQSALNGMTFNNFSTLNGPLSITYNPQVFDPFYVNYLEYRLADRLCTAYNFETPAQVKVQLLKYMEMISKRSSPRDLSINKVSTMTEQNSINYAQVNLGDGWTT